MGLLGAGSLGELGPQFLLRLPESVDSENRS
jgi:hypothetical protein